MICLHYYLVSCTCEVWSLVCQGLYYHEQLFRVDVPVALTAVHHFRHECDGVEFPLLVALLQYSADGIGQGVGVHNEGTFKVRVSEYGCGRYCVN